MHFFESLSNSLFIQNLKAFIDDAFAAYPIAFPLAITAVAALLILIFCHLRLASPKEITAEIKREIKNKVDDVKDFVGVGTRPRFRKRDKIYFYGRKMLRKVKATIPGNDEGRARRLARRLLLGRGERDITLLRVVEPPPEYLQEDPKLRHGDLPTEFMKMLRNMRLFSHYDTSMFLELCKSLVSISLKRGEHLFSIGNMDDHIYLVQSGRVCVSVCEQDGTEYTLKEAVASDSIFSMLSICDVFTGHKQPFKTLSAYALEDSIVMKFPVEAIQSIFQQQPALYVRAVQIIMARLMRVTFMAMHSYLGLSSELISRVPRRTSNTLLSSPSKLRGDCSFVSALSAPAVVHAESTHLEQDSAAPAALEESSYGAESAVKPPTAPSGGKRLVLVDPLDDDNERFLEIAVTKVQALLQLPTDELLKEGLMIRDVEAGEYIMKEDSNADVALVYILTGSLQMSQKLPSPDIMSDKLRTEHPTCGPASQAQSLFRASRKIKSNVGISSSSSSSTSTPKRRSEGSRKNWNDPDALVANDRVDSETTVEDASQVYIFTAYPGDMVGGLSVLSGDPPFFNVRAIYPSKVAFINMNTFHRILQCQPKVALHVANTVITRMSPFVRQIDFALDWEHLEAGRALYRQGEKTSATFIVLSGRLRSVITLSESRKQVIAEYGKGDLVGIVELLTESERSTTVMAVRDSELARLPDGLFNLIKLKHPTVMARLIKMLGQRLIGSWRSSVSREPLGLSLQQQSHHSSFSTVAVLPISEDVPLTQFTLELFHSLHAIGATARLTSDYVVRSLGTSIWEAGNEHQLISWLGQVEDQHQTTLYQCDAHLTVWTQRCIRQADVILAVGIGTNTPQLGKLEEYIEQMARRTQKVLVLLHREDGPPPKGTVRWLNARSYCHAHHHIRAPNRVFHARGSYYKILDYYTSKVLNTAVNIHSDFSRLARVLTGTSVGLVLGGGGARGAAHIGIIKAIKEAGLPVDMVAGVSIGALFGALYCLENDLARCTQKARSFSMKMTSKWRLFIELTYPIVSMFSGSGFNQLIREVLGDTQIEDLWLPFFTLTTDITDSTARIHTHGSTWRYVRASMSLSGYMPPLCDPVDGHLLLDGGYVNNLPADELRNKWNVGSILAIDVGSTFDSNFTNYGDCLSGFELLFRKTFPFKYFFRSKLRVPNLYDIQTRLSYVSCIRQLEMLKSSDYCEYIRPPIDRVQTLQFNLFDEVKEIGYQHGASYFRGMSKSGRPIEEIYRLRRRSAVETSSAVACLNPAHPGYTDLAQVVCNVGKPTPCGSVYDSTTEDDEMLQEGYTSEPNTNTRDFLQTSLELSDVRRRRTGSLSDNDIIDLHDHEDGVTSDDVLLDEGVQERNNIVEVARTKRVDAEPALQHEDNENSLRKVLHSPEREVFAKKDTVNTDDALPTLSR